MEDAAFTRRAHASDGCATEAAPSDHFRGRARPSDQAWPDANAWEGLRQSVGTNLIAVRPLFGAEDGRSPQPGELEPSQGIRNPFWIGDQSGGTETSGWLDAWSPKPNAYAIKARNTADIVSGVNFARENNLRLVIKGTGHSYLGTSNAPDSLMIWTRGMNDVIVHDAFLGRCCEGRAAPVTAVSAGAGAMWVDLYNAVTVERGRYVQGGGCMTVGVAGLIQGGGFGVFSKNFGTAASALLEAEIVTADGNIRIVNACSAPDLFWALKGGGGGTFGVVTRLTLQTFDLPDFFGFATGEIDASSECAFAHLVERFVSFYERELFNPHWGDHVHFGPGNRFELAMVCQGLDDARARDVWTPFFEWIEQAPEDYTVKSALRAGAMPARDWWDPGKSDLLTRDTRLGAPAHHAWSKCDQAEVGVFLHHYDSVWLPGELLQACRQAELVGALLAGSRHQMIRLQIAKGLAGAPRKAREAARDTATNPLMIDAFALAVVADGESPAYPGQDRPALDVAAARKNARAIERAMAELRTVAPNAGSYVSESSFFIENWQEAFWGDNYQLLLATKRKYDPQGLFFVHHGVGSEGWSADGFEYLGHGQTHK